MNKRGQLGGEDTNMLKIIGSVFLVVIVVGAIAYGIYNSGSKGNALLDQFPNDVSAIAAVCKLAAESGVTILASPYCIQAREVNFGKSVLGIGGSKQIVNCPYAESKGWFTSTNNDPKKPKPTCADDGKWPKEYCESLKKEKQEKYKDTVVVNGQICGIGGWGIKADIVSGSAPTTAPVVASAKTCEPVGPVGLGGIIKLISEPCPTDKPNTAPSFKEFDAIKPNKCCIV